MTALSLSMATGWWSRGDGRYGPVVLRAEEGRVRPGPRIHDQELIRRGSARPSAQWNTRNNQSGRGATATS